MDLVYFYDLLYCFRKIRNTPTLCPTIRASPTVYVTPDLSSRRYTGMRSMEALIIDQVRLFAPPPQIRRVSAFAPDAFTVFHNMSQRICRSFKYRTYMICSCHIHSHSDKHSSCIFIPQRSSLSERYGKKYRSVRSPALTPAPILFK